MDDSVYMAHITQPRIKIRSGVIYQAQQDAGGISRDELSRRLGVATATAYRIEMGKTDPSPAFIAALMIFTRKTFEDLFAIETADVAA